MRVAVIGDYGTPEYKELLQRVRIAFSEEYIIDMSRHLQSSWKDRLELRILDMDSAHLVIVCSKWDHSVDVKRDITEAQKINRDLVIEHDGRFIPFTHYAARQ